MIYEVIKTGQWSISDFYFPIELVVSEIIFLLALEKRKKFWLRIIGYAVALFLFVLFVPPYIGSGKGFDSEADIFVQLYSMAYSIGIFLFTFLCSVLLFSDRKRNVLFCCIAGYCVQHITFRILEVIYLFVGPEINWLRLLIRVLLDFSSYLLFWIFLARELRLNDGIDMGNKNVLVVSFIAIFINVVLCSFCRMEKIGVITQIAESSYSAGCCILILCLQFNLFQIRSLEKKNDMIEHLWEEDRKHYQINKAYIDEINQKAHDLKYALGALRCGGGKDYADETEKSLRRYATMFHTGNEALDIVLTEKSMLCSTRKIRLTCLADGKDLLFMKDVDLYSCIGNALDNAITAVEKVPEEDKKLIALSLVRKNGMLCLHIENYYVGELDIRGGILRTTKEDKRSHGIGMRSIEMIAKKYDGSVSFSGEDRIFRLNIVFAVPEKTEKEENA